MLSKNITLFLIITSSYSFLIRAGSELYNYFAYDYYRDSIESILWFTVYISTPIVWLFLGYSLQRKTSLKKPMAIVLSILAGLSIALLFFSIYQLFFDKTTKNYPNLLEQTLRIGVSIALYSGYLTLGVSLFGKQLQRIKNACIWLLMSLTLVIIADFSNIIVRIFGYGIGEIGSIPFTIQVASILEIIFYISLLVFITNLYQNIGNKEKTEHAFTPTTIPTPINWLGNYSLAAIPFIGSVLLIIWAFIDENKIRRNWAIGTFLASILFFTLNLVVFTQVLNFYILREEVLLIGLLTLFVFIILGSVLIYRYNQRIPFEGKTEEEHENPSIQIWLANFLIVAIPLIGLICLIIWAVDHKNKIIRNWAIARLMWLGISIVFTLFIYIALLEIERIKSMIYLQF